MSATIKFGTTGPALDRARAAMLRLPRVVETLQFGDNLVFWTLDKAVGGRMFALIDLEGGRNGAIAFAAGPERAAALLEIDGVRPAPYLARAHWVSLADWHVLPQAQLLDELAAAYEYVGRRMPARVQRLYELPAREYRALVREAASQEQAVSQRGKR